MGDETKRTRDVPVLRTRTKQYALRVIRLYASLDKDTVSQVLGRPLLRSGTSVGAHHRERGRARSVAEFVSKMEGGLQSWTRPPTGWNCWPSPAPCPPNSSRH